MRLESTSSISDQEVGRLDDCEEIVYRSTDRMVYVPERLPWDCLRTIHEGTPEREPGANAVVH